MSLIITFVLLYFIVLSLISIVVCFKTGVRASLEVFGVGTAIVAIGSIIYLYFWILYTGAMALYYWLFNKEKPTELEFLFIILVIMTILGAMKGDTYVKYVTEKV